MAVDQSIVGIARRKSEPSKCFLDPSWKSALKRVAAICLVVIAEGEVALDRLVLCGTRDSFSFRRP